MELDFVVVLDRDKAGEIKRTKGGDWRFTLRLRQTDGIEVLSIEGFRLNEEMTQIEPPVVYGRYSSIRIIKMGRDFEERVLAGVVKMVKGEA